MSRLWRTLLCRVWGHGAATDWYMPWLREAMTGRWLERDILTVCERCGATLNRRTVTE